MLSLGPSPLVERYFRRLTEAMVAQLPLVLCDATEGAFTLKFLVSNRYCTSSSSSGGGGGSRNRRRNGRGGDGDEDSDEIMAMMMRG